MYRYIISYLSMALLVRCDPAVPAYIGLLTQPQGDQPSTGLTAGATAIYRYADSCCQLLTAGTTEIWIYTDSCYHLLTAGITAIRIYIQRHFISYWAAGATAIDGCYQLLTASKDKYADIFNQLLTAGATLPLLYIDIQTAVILF